MKASKFLFVFVIVSYLITQNTIVLAQQAKNYASTDVTFKTSNTRLQRIFDEAKKKAKWNINQFGAFKVLVEGADYQNVWLETQPIGGCMFAKFNVEIAANNQLIFMDLQRDDGRLAGAIAYDKGKFNPRFQELQGGFLPLEAFDVYFWAGKDLDYIKKLYTTLEKYDNYLWKYRDSDNNNCLEVWGTGDTGEDRSTRFGNAYHSWMFDFPPTLENIYNMSAKDSVLLCSDICNQDYRKSSYRVLYNPVFPMESMDMMAYSYGNRIVLSKISEITGNGKAKFWSKKAAEVQKNLKKILWLENKHACYDRDNANNVIDILVHNNLRCMYFGVFNQQMADDFVKYHLMNPKEFWTPLPLPSIAANDAAFRNISGNNWSGQPEGLTFQRSIRALENYGHYAELSLIGQKFLKPIGDSLKFTQQFDPFTATINNGTDGYGPSILASLEFLSRMYGIHYTQDKIYWSCLSDDGDFEYTQQIGNQIFKLKTVKNMVYCSINGKEVFSFTKGIRIVSNLDGKILQVVGIEPGVKPASIVYNDNNYQLKVKPNCVYSFSEKFELKTKVDFFSPR